MAAIFPLNVSASQSVNLLFLFEVLYGSFVANPDDEVASVSDETVVGSGGVEATCSDIDVVGTCSSLTEDNDGDVSSFVVVVAVASVGGEDDCCASVVADSSSVGSESLSFTNRPRQIGHCPVCLAANHHLSKQDR